VYQSKLSSVSDEFDFFDLLGEMLNELRDGHVNLYSDFDRSRYWNWFEDYPSNFQADLIYSPRYLGSDYRISGGMRYGKIDGGRIGYIYYGDFSSTFTLTNLKFIFDYMSDCEGLILDVRNNGGGYLSSAETLASCFFDKKTLTGYMTHKLGDGHSDFSKPIAMYTEKSDTLSWTKPVMVLTNRLSYSATNAFVSQMKYAPNATIVGDRTGGGGGLPLSNELPNGWMVRFSAVPMYDAAMQHIEWGLDPDVKVDMRSTDAKAGIDTIIERAIALLRVI
jgi:C-terminal processing protease CtpA/Prc